MMGKSCRVDDVAGHNHVATAEEHDGIAVGMGGGLVNDLYALAVQVHRVLVVREGLRRPEPEREERLLTRRRGHPRQHVFMREHARRARVGDEVVAQPGACRHGTGQNAEARLGELFVAADMVGVHARVDDVTDGKRRQSPDPRQDAVRHRRRAGVHEDDALGSGLHDDVAARSADDIEIRPELNHIEAVSGLLLRGHPLRRSVEPKQRGDHDQRCRGRHPDVPDDSTHIVHH